MNIETARALYPEAKQLADLVSEEWTVSYDVSKGRSEVYVRNDQSGEITPIAILLEDCSYDDRRLMEKSPRLLRALVILLERSFAEIRRLQPKQDKPKDYAAECAMKCQVDGLFKQYLMAAHQLMDAGDAERIKTRVRSILAITSMAELNTNPDATARWKQLRGDFDTWRRTR